MVKMSSYDSGNDSILEMYIFESETLLDQLDEILLQSEENEELTPEDINEIFRIMHTVKGSSAMMEFETLAHAAHKLEDLFFAIRENGIDENHFENLMDLVLNFSSYLKDEVEKIRNGQELTKENQDLIDEIDRFLAALNGEAVSVNLADKEADSAPVEEIVDETEVVVDLDLADVESEVLKELEEIVTLEENSGQGACDGEIKVYNLHVRFAADSQMENIRAFMLVNKLGSLGKIVKTIPEQLNNNADAAGIILKNGFYCALETRCDQKRVDDAAHSILSVEKVAFIDAMPATEEDQKALVEEVEVKEDKQKQEQKAKSTEGNQKSTQKAAVQNLISVDLNKLDSLLNLIGEIVITESMVFGSVQVDSIKDEVYEKSSVQLQKLTDELQDIVMSIRMIPIAGTFKKMQRIVRDVGKKLKKEVEFITMGESTEVDKTIIDGIADPLMHLVRNSMDHGLESKEERIAAGKNPVGKVILSAQNVGGDIVISVSDDGKGLDPKSIMEKAKEKRLLVKPEEEYSEKEILSLIMAPGFSTKEQVTEFSGRGVGMDVVKKNIEKVGGSISIESEKGSGTNTFLKIPLTLSIISGMEVKVGEEIFEIPISNIRESFKVTQDQLIKDPDNNEMVMIRGVCYPLIRLHDVFHTLEEPYAIEDGILMLVDSGETLACLFMDDLLKKHQIVVKAIPRYLMRYVGDQSGIAGCTILGNGSISLIIDVPSIVDHY
jgi:two-component system chemotaxis sensor kinase CheA